MDFGYKIAQMFVNYHVANLDCIPPPVEEAGESHEEEGAEPGGGGGRPAARPRGDRYSIPTNMMRLDVIEGDVDVSFFQVRVPLEV